MSYSEVRPSNTRIREGWASSGHRVRQPFDVVHGVLRLTSDAHGLIFGHVPRVLRIHGTGPFSSTIWMLMLWGWMLVNLTFKRRRRGGAVVVGANRREGLQALNV